MIGRFSWLAIAGVARQVSFLVVSLLLVDRLSTEIFGTLTLGFSAVLLLTGLSEFGLRQIGWAEIAKRPHRAVPITSVILYARVLTGGAALTLYVAFVFLVGDSPEERLLLAFFAPNLLFNAVAFDFPFLAVGRMGDVGRRVIAVYAGYACSVAVLVTSDQNAWLAPVLLSTLHLTLCVSLYLRFRRSHSSPWRPTNPRRVRKMLRRSAPLGGNFLLTRAANNYSILVLGFVGTREDVASYRLAEIGFLFLSSLGVHAGGAAYASLARRAGVSRDDASTQLSFLIRWLFVAGVAGATAYATGWCAVLGTLIADSPDSLPWLVLILASGIVPALLARFLRTTLPGLGVRKELLPPTLCGVGIGVAGGAVLSAAAGPLGMASAVVLSEIAACLLLLRALSRRGYRIRLQTPLASSIISHADEAELARKSIALNN